MTARDWRIQVRDANLNRLGELSDYTALDMVLKYNDISTWRLTIDRRSRMAAALRTPGAGIIVTRDGNTVLSGYWVEEEHTRGTTRNELTLSGHDDTGWLARRWAHPQPNSAGSGPPYSTQAEDVRTGQASTVIRDFVSVNADSSAPSTRKIPGLAVGGDLFVGATVTGRGRWQSLLALVQELADKSEAAGSPVGFVVRQTGNILSVFVYPPVEAADTIRFSLGLGNLAEFAYRRTAPTCTYAVVGGSGEGTARTIYEKPNSAAIAQWGRIEGELVSASTNVAAELSQAADKELLDNGVRTSLSVTPIDTEHQRYGIDYVLGYRVTAILDDLGPDGETVAGEQVQDIIREVKITLTGGDEKIVPSVGSGAKLDPYRIFDTVRRLGRRTNNLERG